jgi:hypothetical protein
MKAIPLLIAHQGGKYWEGRNFSHITESIKVGASIIEIDVRRNNGTYIVQHMPYERPQGLFVDALRRCAGVGVYLDIKDENADIPEIVGLARDAGVSRIIIGSFHLDLLRSTVPLGVERNCHCIAPWNAIARGIYAHADWVNPICYVVTRGLAQDIQESGFKFVPSGNLVFQRKEIFRNQLRYATYGAYAVSAHHIKELREALARLS